MRCVFTSGTKQQENMGELNFNLFKKGTLHCVIFRQYKAESPLQDAVGTTHVKSQD